ncbi:MAG: threonine--tRNA ligase, partial [Verrucomicrobia bacterium]|nr:threonine--tRNA ligase [Verrucomicrobiota bacterium]
SENTDAIPLCIHRAPLGTHERFIAFLIEHYAGNFPLWLAPEQVRILPITSDLNEYVSELVKELRGRGVRAEGDYGNDKVNAKIRDAECDKVHTILIVGRKEREAGTVSVRIHGKGDQGAKPWNEFVEGLITDINDRN